MEYVRMIKYFLAFGGILLVMIAKIKYQQRTQKMIDKSTPYSQTEQRMIYAGYGCCAMAIVFVILFN